MKEMVATCGCEPLCSPEMLESTIKVTGNTRCHCEERNDVAIPLAKSNKKRILSFAAFTKTNFRPGVRAKWTRLLRKMTSGRCAVPMRTGLSAIYCSGSLLYMEGRTSAFALSSRYRLLSVTRLLMRRYTLILLLLTAVPLQSLMAQPSGSSAVAPYIQRAEEFFYKGRVEDSIKELKRALKIDGDNGRIYVLLAKNYLRFGDAHGRTEAEKAAKKAIDLEPDNVDNMVLLAKIFTEQGFAENAQKLLEDVTERFPENADALYLLGKLYHDNAEKYRNLVSADQRQLMYYIYMQNRYGTLVDALDPRENRSEEYPVIYFDEYFNENVGRAGEVYQKLLEIDSTREDLAMDMTLLAYKQKDWQGMVRAAERYRALNPGDPKADLMFGLALHRSAEFEKAETVFQEYAKTLGPYERRLFEEFDFFLSETEQTAIARMGPIAGEVYHDKFWLARDPLYLTGHNERKLEHYARIAEANLLFANRLAGPEGWRTDRGIIWVRYGEPERLNRNLNILSEHGSLRARFGRPRNYQSSEDLYEVWFYDGFSFMFYEFPLWSGNVKFYDGSDVSFSNYAKSVQKMLPDRYEMQAKGRRFEFPLYAVDFRGTGENTRVELFYGIPAVAFAREKTDAGYHISGVEGAFIFDPSWNWSLREIDTLRHVYAEPVDSTREDLIIARRQAVLHPGEYKLAVEFTDDRSDNYGRMSSTLSVEAYRYDSLQVSDVLLATHIAPGNERKLFSIADLEFIPNVTRRFLQSQEIFLYFEIYNLGLTGDPGTSRFRVEYAVRHRESADDEWKLSDVLGRLFNFSQNASLLALSTEYDGAHPVENMYIEIDPGSLKRGMYRLTLLVTDLRSGQNAEKEAVFYLGAD